MIETHEVLLKTKKIDTFFVLLVAQDHSTFLPILENIFSNVFVASTQAESLELFDTHPMDLVIIDTQSSRYHWLTLVHQFRLKVYDIYIALIVDMLTCKDANTFILADVASHFFKPLDPEIVCFELYDLMHKIDLKKESKIFQDLKERRKIQSLAFYTIRRIIEEIPSPIFAYNANEKNTLL
jgi:response regulator RpfG family c-di-GMP phosphodiesterase